MTASKPSATAITMFLTWYVIATLVSLVDQLDGVHAEVGLGRRRGRLDSVCNEGGEIALKRGGVAVHREALQVEADPADDVVNGVLARSGKRVENRKEKDGVLARLERVLDIRRAELGARVGLVAPEREVLVVSVQDPVSLRRGADCSAAAREVEHPECTRRPHRVEVESRLLVEAWATGAGQQRMRVAHDHRSDVQRLCGHLAACDGACTDGDALDAKNVAEEAGCAVRGVHRDRVV